MSDKNTDEKLNTSFKTDNHDSPLTDHIQLLESPIPAAPAAAAAPAPSQKASSGDISGTKRGIIDPLVSKQPEKILNQKIKKNCQNGSKMVKMVSMV